MWRILLDMLREVKNSVGRVAEISDTYKRVWFSFFIF